MTRSHDAVICVYDDVSNELPRSRPTQAQRLAPPPHLTPVPPPPSQRPSRQIRTYTELRQKIHNDLRLQHPEWVQPGGEAPICDSYEARLMELIDALTRSEAERVQESPTI